MREIRDVLKESRRRLDGTERLENDGSELARMGRKQSLQRFRVVEAKRVAQRLDGGRSAPP